MNSTNDPVHRDSRLAAVVLFLAAATLAKTPSIAGLTAGDLLYLAACIVSARWVVTNSRIARSRWNGLAVVLVLWAMTAGVPAPIVSELDFSDLEFVKSLVRLSVLVAGALLLITLVEGASPKWIGRVLLFTMTINAALAIILYAAAWLAPGFLEGAGWFDRFTLTLPMGQGTAIGVVRARGIFNEPAHLGLFQGLGLGYLAFVSRDLLTRFHWQKSLVLISVVLTLSLGAFALVAAIGLILLLQRGTAQPDASRTQVVPIAMAVLFLGITAVAMVQLGTDDALLGRLTRVATAKDLSASARVVGSWDVALEIATRAPVIGSGVGNLAIAAESFGYMFEAGGRTLVAIPSWNLFAFSLATMGAIGLILYSLLVLEVAIRNLGAGIVIALAGFVTGGLLVATIWVFFALYAADYQSDGQANNKTPAIIGTTIR